MGTNRGANKYILRFFKGSREHTGHIEERSAFQAIKPNLHAICFQGKEQLKRKENTSQGSIRHHRIRFRCRTLSSSWLGNFEPIPFREQTNICVERPYLLGATNPCPSAVHMEPFSASVFKNLIRIFATTTKIYTKSNFTQARAKSFMITHTPSYSPQHTIAAMVEYLSLA